MAFGIGDDQGHLARQVLDVMNDKGEVPVEILKPARPGERLSRFRFREIAGRLSTRCLEELKILPAHVRCGAGYPENDETDQTASVNERQDEPGALMTRQPL